MKNIIQKLKETTKEQYIPIGLVGVLGGFILGLSVPNTVDGRMKEIHSPTALLVGREGHPLVTNTKGTEVPACDARTGFALKKFGPCKAKVEVKDGKPILVDVETGEPLGKDRIISEVIFHIWNYRGSHCSKHYWVGGREYDLC